MAGNDAGNFILFDVSQDNLMNNQLLIKGHNSAINIIKKTNDNIVITSSTEPDYSIKIWDVSKLIVSLSTN